jgi:hypothetical protein
MSRPARPINYVADYESADHRVIEAEPAIAIDNVDIVHPLRAPEKNGVVGGLL